MCVPNSDVGTNNMLWRTFFV